MRVGPACFYDDLVAIPSIGVIVSMRRRGAPCWSRFPDATDSRFLFSSVGCCREPFTTVVSLFNTSLEQRKVRSYTVTFRPSSL